MDSGGFRAAPQGMFGGIVQSVSAFRPYRNGFRIRTDSVESPIWTDSDGFQYLKYGSRQPSSEQTLEPILEHDSMTYLQGKHSLSSWWLTDTEAVV